MKKQLWINLSPRKLYWELAQLDQYKTLDHDSWWQELEPLKTSLQILKSRHIHGIRLNIFNLELVRTPQEIDWTPLEVTLKLCKSHEIDVDVCLGPYQYPLWPGIRLPAHILTEVKRTKNLDDCSKIREFGLLFLKEQLKQYGTDRRIKSFYLGNEWHTDQAVEDVKKSKKYFISDKHMLQLTRLCKRMTKKPIIFNTNYDATELKKIDHTFGPLWNVLRDQAWLALDVYPSQEIFSKVPRLWVKRKLEKYPISIEKLQKGFTDQLLFGEFEAQPWGKGKSWKEYFESSIAQKDFNQGTYQKTVESYVKPTEIRKVTLWGGEYLIVSQMLGKKFIP